MFLQQITLSNDDDLDIINADNLLKGCSCHFPNTFLPIDATKTTQDISNIVNDLH